MFLIERLFGVSCYALLMFFVFILISKTNAKLSKIFIFYTISLSLMAFFYTPYKTADFYRILKIVDYYGGFEWNYFFENAVISSSTPFATIVYWIFGKLNIAKLLPCFSCVTCYSIIFYVINDIHSYFSLKRADTALMVLFVMSSGIYIPVISGIRMMISICLVLLCMYQEYKEKHIRWFHPILYLIALLTHNIAVAVIGIALFTFLLLHSSGFKKKALLVVSVLLGLIFIVLRNTDLISLIIVKASYYLTDETYFDIWEFIIACFSLFLSTVILIKSKKIKKEKDFFRSYLTVCFIVAVILISSFSIYHRLVVETGTLMILPVLAVILSDKINKSNIFFRNTFFIGCLILLLLNASRGGLSSLKFFEL